MTLAKLLLTVLLTAALAACGAEPHLLSGVAEPQTSPLVGVAEPQPQALKAHMVPAGGQ